MTHPRTKRVASFVVVALAFLGFALSAARAFGVVDSHLLRDGTVPDMSRLDHAAVPILSGLIGAGAGTPTYRRLEVQVARLYGKFNEQPTLTLSHVLPAALMMVLAPLQFSATLRQRRISWHRWSGRVIVLIAVPIGISGLLFGLFMPFAGHVEASAIAVFGTWFLFALFKGFTAIRRGAVTRHRAWMIRVFSVALGVIVVRVVGIPLAILTREPPAAWFGQSVWIGFALAVLLGECWIGWYEWERRDSTRAAA